MTVEDRISDLATELSVDESVLETVFETHLAAGRSKPDVTSLIRCRFDAVPSGVSVIPTEDVSTDHETVSVIGVISRAGRRTVQVDGEIFDIIEGTIEDEHGELPFTVWDDFSHGIGDAILIKEAGVRYRHGRPELAIDMGSSITTVPDTFEVTGSMTTPDTLADLSPGDRDCLISVSVLSSGPQCVSGRNGPTRIRRGILGDGTARLPFIDWEARSTLSEGTAVRIRNAFVRSYKGIPQINLGRYTDVFTNADSVSATGQPPREELSSIARSDGRFDVITRGTVVDIAQGTGIVRRCDSCRRILRSGACPVHGDGPAFRDLRSKALVDDGSEVVTALFSRAETAALAGLDRDTIHVQGLPAVRSSTLRSRLRTRAVGTTVQLRGRYRIGDYEHILEVTNCQQLSPRPSSRATELLGHVKAYA